MYYLTGKETEFYREEFKPPFSIDMRESYFKWNGNKEPSNHKRTPSYQRYLEARKRQPVPERRRKVPNRYEMLGKRREENFRFLHGP